MNDPEIGKESSVLLGKLSIARWLIEPMFHQVHKPDLTIICNYCNAAIPSTQITEDLKHSECGLPISHPFITDPLLSHIVIMFDDFTCGRANFFDDLATYVKAGKKVTVLEYLQDQRTLSYLIKDVHYTNLVPYKDIKWPTRLIDQPSETKHMIGWVGNYYPDNSGLQEAIAVCRSANIPISIHGFMDSFDGQDCVVSYAHYEFLAQKFPDVSFWVHKSPLRCISEAAKCRWLMRTQTDRWLFNFCSSAHRCIINQSSIKLEDMSWYTHHDLSEAARYFNITSLDQKIV